MFVKDFKYLSGRVPDFKDDPGFDENNFNKLVNDTGRKTVPCLYIDDKPMHESDDINAWLMQNKAEIS